MALSIVRGDNLPEFNKHEAFAPFPELAALLQKCLSHRSEDRPAIQEFLEPLRSLVSHVLTQYARPLLI